MLRAQAPIARNVTFFGLVVCVYKCRHGSRSCLYANNRFVFALFVFFRFCCFGASFRFLTTEGGCRRGGRPTRAAFSG